MHAVGQSMCITVFPVRGLQVKFLGCLVGQNRCRFDLSWQYARDAMRATRLPVLATRAKSFEESMEIVSLCLRSDIESSKHELSNHPKVRCALRHFISSLICIKGLGWSLRANRRAAVAVIFQNRWIPSVNLAAKCFRSNPVGWVCNNFDFIPGNTERGLILYYTV